MLVKCRVKFDAILGNGAIKNSMFDESGITLGNGARKGAPCLMKVASLWGMAP
ncbi:hypothetical protein ACQCT4_03315 [Metabacillus indicus]